LSQKLHFEKPKLIFIGKLEEVTGEGGKNNDDGYRWSKLAKSRSLYFSLK